MARSVTRFSKRRRRPRTPSRATSSVLARPKTLLLFVVRVRRRIWRTNLNCHRAIVLRHQADRPGPGLVIKYDGFNM
jgi:hypothetical protein